MDNPFAEQIVAELGIDDPVRPADRAGCDLIDGVVARSRSRSPR